MHIFSQYFITLVFIFMNILFDAAKDIQNQKEPWLFKNCCYLIRNLNCKVTCKVATNLNDLSTTCRPSDEPRFAFCIEHRRAAEKCCNNIANITCKLICQDLFYISQSESFLKMFYSKGCYHQTPKCLQNIDYIGAIEDLKHYAKCCELAPNWKCLDTCRNIFYTAKSISDIFMNLEETCHPVLPHLPLWSCFMKKPSTEISRLPIDIGKLICCSKAKKRVCQNLCRRAFQIDWSALHELESECLTTNKEGDLKRCIDDVDETCEIGCSGLSFCAVFNNRFNMLFRTCTSTADAAAQSISEHWIREGIITGLGASVHISSSCPNDALRITACFLQLRPCEPRNHETRICRDDCLKLLTACVDWTSFNSHNASTICAKLSPAKVHMPCVSLKPITETMENHEKNPLQGNQITIPCKSNPCLRGEICTVHLNNQNKYHCIAGCPLGVMSNHLIPLGSWAQLPRIDQQTCHKVCLCTATGLERCRNLNCLKLNACWTQTRFIAHRETFYHECNACQCFEGEITCTRKNCADLRIFSLPCECPKHYVPVCGRLGVTYSSPCLARCAGLNLNEIKRHTCSSNNPCFPNPCKNGHRCFKKPKVCLSHIYKPCMQYECLPLNCTQNVLYRIPICDKNNNQHESLCSMARAGASLAYRGPCLKGCNLKGPVCAINGEIYHNECAAWAAKSSVDYFGPCITSGYIRIRNHVKMHCTELIQCPRLIFPHCIGITPPGSCCPKCGGAARLFYSRKQLDRIYYMMTKDEDKEFVTLSAMLTALERQFQVSECVLRGMMTQEGDIFIINEPVFQSPTSVQVTACIIEIEKLVSRIMEHSPRIVVEVPMGSLTRAEIEHEPLSSHGATYFKKNELLLLVSSVIMLLYYLTKFHSSEFPC